MVLASTIAAVVPPDVAEAQKSVAVRGTGAADARRGEELLARPITVDLSGVTREKAIDAITAKARVLIQYREAALAMYTDLVTIHAREVPVGDVLAQVLTGTSLTVVVDPTGRIGIVGRRTAAIRGDSAGTITGRVTDSATGKAIPHATVSISPGKKASVSTNGLGLFTVNGVPTGEYVIVIKTMGYMQVTRRVQITGENPHAAIVVGMRPTATVLSGVVTTVTGTQRKLEVGNDITTLDVPEIMKQASIRNVTDLLEARVPGLTVTRTSGVPGASSRLRLRGIGGGSLSNVPGAPTNDPIVIVDGIRIYAGQSGVDDQKLGGGKYATQSPIDQIDPNSIETIEVLRGPSASAMYGSDAANGVIVITTKKGKPGATRWDVAASRGIESMPGVYAAPGYYRFGQLPNGGGDQECQILQSPEYFNCHVDSLVRFQALNEPRLSTLGHGSNTGITVTASGGTPALTYSMTGSMANTQGLTKMPSLYQDLFQQLYDSAPSRQMRRPNWLEERSGQATFAADLSKGLTATFTTSLSRSLQQQSSANTQLAALASTYIDTTNINPAEFGEYAEQLTTDATVVRHALALNLSRWERLPLSATFGLDRAARGAEQLTPRGILHVKTRVFFPSAPTVVVSEISKGAFTERQENLSTTTARVNGTLFPGARLSVSMGAEATGRSSDAMDGVSDTLTQGVSRPSTLIAGTRSGRSTTTGGWFVEPRLNLNSRFFVNPGFRFDGGGGSGSRGGVNGGLWSLFPKLNFSWIAIDREGREPLWGVISLVRPRAAFGVAGVQPGTEMSVRTLEQNVDTWNASPLDTIAPDLGLRVRSVGNTRLGPEKTREMEGGVDLQLWDTRLSLSATGFYKMRKNAIQELPLAPSIGVGRTMIYAANIGHVRNTGAEFSLNATVLDVSALRWTLDVSVSKYTNTLVKLFGEQPYIDLGNGTRLAEGYPLFTRWSRPISGWSDPKNGTQLWYGDYVVDDSAVAMGSQSPDFEMPFRTALTLFRGLVSVNAQFDYKAGLTQYNLGSGALLGNIYANPTATVGQQAYALAAACYLDKVRLGAGTAGLPCTDYGFIQKINSLRFNSMSIGYTVPRAYVKRLPFSSLSLLLQGSNLGLWTNYRGKDPDVNGALIGDATQDSGQLPTPRTWSLHIRIGT